MRSLKLIPFLILLSSEFLFAKVPLNLCPDNSSVQTYFANENSIIECKFPETTEENQFYIFPSKSTNIYKIESSRLITDNGMSEKLFDQLKSSRKLCDNIKWNSQLTSGYIFGLKQPNNNGGYCFGLELYNLKSNKNIQIIDRNNLTKMLLTDKNIEFYNSKEFSFDTSLDLNVNRLFNDAISTQSFEKINLAYEVNDEAIILNNYKANNGQKWLQIFIPKINKIVWIINKEKLSTLLMKTFLYKESSESSQSKMYLIAGDKVKLLDTKTDKSGQEWYYISYQGKKEIKAWIKAEAVK